jgi:hypothetical protein
MSAKPSPPKNLPEEGDIRAVLAHNIQVARVAKGLSQVALTLKNSDWLWRLSLGG